MADQPFRLLPRLTPETEPFWTGGAEGALRFWRCQSCGYWLHPPGPLCPECLSKELAVEVVSGDAVLHTYTVNHRAPNAFMKARLPYVVAIVELDEGPRLMANIQGEGALDAAIGKRVKVLFEPVSDELALPQFALLE